MLGSTKDNKNGIVVEIKKAEKRKCEVEDTNRYWIKYRIVDFRMPLVRIP